LVLLLFPHFFQALELCQVKDLAMPFCIVSGAEKTAITLASFFKELILCIIIGIESPSAPIALPPNFATISLVNPL